MDRANTSYIKHHLQAILAKFRVLLSVAGLELVEDDRMVICDGLTLQVINCAGDVHKGVLGHAFARLHAPLQVNLRNACARVGKEATDLQVDVKLM